MMFSRTQKILFLAVCGIWAGCSESSKRSIPPSGNALPKPTFRLGEWCQGSLKAEEQRTLDALINSIGAETCTEFEYRYEKMSLKHISIPYEELLDPAPLLALTDLESLSIRGNKFSNISWTKSFEALKALDASENPLGQDSALLSTVTIAPNIRDLSLDRTGIKEITYQDDSVIHKLSLAGNSIESLDFLIDFVSLHSLHLDENLIADLTALTQLSQLEVLSLGSNPIQSLSPLANLVSLKDLNLARLDIDISLTAEVLPSQLEKISLYLPAPGGKKVDLSGASSMPKLRVLDASGRIVTGMLAKESALTELILERAVIPDFQILKKFSNLQSLNLNDAGLVALPNLKLAEKLTTLTAEGNALTFVDGRLLPASLRVLNLSRCSVSEIKGSDQLPNLYELSLKGNKIISLADFAWPVSLRVLNLSENSIQSLPDLSPLNALTSLNLARNRIKNPSALAALLELEQLDLSHNQLELVAPLAPLKKLTLLDIRSNGLSSAAVCPLLNASACLF
jgi:internalin A